MEIISDISALPQRFRGGALSIGNFDGVHRGHARIIECLCALAEKIAGPVVVFTFDPHPVRILRPEHAPPPLTWTKRKAELLSELGVDVMVVYPTDEQILSLGPQAFFHQLVCQSLSARAVAEGPNFFFGHDRRGTIDTLRELCRASDIPLEIVEPLLDAGDFISSSRIRKAIQRGDADEARRLLTQPYRIRGMVTHGAAGCANRLSHGESGCHRHLVTRTRRLCGTGNSRKQSPRRGDQRRPKSDVRRGRR